MLLTAALATMAVATPCTVPERAVACPDLVMRRPYGMRLVRTPKRALLAATNAIVNVGEGPLEIRARRRNIGEDQMTTRQVLRPALPGGAAQVLPATGSVDFFDTRTRGRYWKYQGAASFTLRPIAADGTVGRIRRTGDKVDYCFRDLTKVRRLDGAGAYPGTPRARVFGACSTTDRALALTLGTSVGWADIYPWDYPQNSIDVTSLTGCFLYTLKADPKDELEELREDNNTGSVVVRLPWRGPGARGCPVPAA
ncbi:MAG: hypothetical protein JWO90_2151 [Solirubrobacterales bacterium]|jgi:hypothetical protein|nr:hypothetical protein [Solirubrobacterales bacterium]